MVTALKKAREARQLSAREVATELGIHWTTYYRYEAGTQTPTSERARTIHEYFGGEVSWLDIYDPAMNAG